MFSALRQFAERTVSSRSSTGTQEDRIDLVFGVAGDGLRFALEIDEHRKLLLQDRGGAADGLFGIYRAVGFEIQHQLVEVRALLDTGASTT
jgi:hypothetical protein